LQIIFSSFGGEEMHRLNRHTIVLSASVFCVLLGFYEATRAQQTSTATLTVDKQQLIFTNVPGGGGGANQIVNITSSAATVLNVNTAN
jgi:hypothetical protein